MTHAASKQCFDDMYHSTATARTTLSVSERGKELFCLQDTASELVAFACLRAWLERASKRVKIRAVRYCITTCTVVPYYCGSGLHFVG